MVLAVLLLTYSHKINTYFGGSRYSEFIVLILLSFLVIASSAISYVLRLKNRLIAILFSLSLFAVPILFTAILASIENYYRQSDNQNYISILHQYGFWVIMFIWLVSIAIYTVYIRKLKALPK